MQDHLSSTAAQALADAAQKLDAIDRYGDTLDWLRTSFRATRQTLRAKYDWLDYDLWADDLHQAAAQVFTDAAHADSPRAFVKANLTGLTGTATEAGEELHYAITRHRRQIAHPAHLPSFALDRMAEVS